MVNNHDHGESRAITIYSLLSIFILTSYTCPEKSEDNLGLLENIENAVNISVLNVGDDDKNRVNACKRNKKSISMSMQ